FAKPRGYLDFLHLIRRNLLVSRDCALPVLAEGICECSVIRKERTPLPTVGKLPEPAQRERLDERFLEPLAWIAWLAVGIPAVGQDVAKLVAELVGELGPVSGPHVDDNGGALAAVVAEPDRWIARAMIFDPKPAWLPIGQESRS